MNERNERMKEGKKRRKREKESEKEREKKEGKKERMVETTTKWRRSTQGFHVVPNFDLTSKLGLVSVVAVAVER